MDSPIAFIPIDRRHALAKGVNLPDPTRGTALFADISGFTPLTEALSKMLGQRRGAEEISRQLNHVYDALINEVERYGGSVINFAGDAITCWFEGDEGARATASALMMQKAMAQFTALMLPSGGMVTLAMKAAVAGGSVRRLVVGNPQIQLIDVLAGATLGRMSVVEHHANRTEVVLSPECFPAVAESALVLEWRPDRESTAGTLYPVIGGLLRPIDPQPWPELALDLLTEEQVRPWLLPDVYERLDEGQSKFLAELRPASALFLRFSGIDYDEDAEAGRKLNDYLCWVQEKIHYYEGFLLQVSVGDKGSYCYAAFGAPVAHDDDPVRAAAAAQTLRATPSEFNFITSVQLGLSHGRMWAGAYGGATRRTYGVLGDDVNLAARLMQTAGPGQVLASQVVVDSTASAFGWEALTPIKVKGRAQPVAIYQLAQSGPTQYRRMAGRARAEALAMVGREAERERLVGALHDLTAQRQSGVFIIEGEAGIGKTRLLDELQQAARAEHVPVFSGVGDAIEKAAYQAWREVFYALLNWAALAEPEARRQSILAALGEERAGLAPLLNDVVKENLFEENDLTRNLVGKPRADSTREVLLSILHESANRAPLLLILEDAHWLDSQSWALALAVQQRARNAPLLFILATRPLTESLPEFTQLAQSPTIQRLRLQPLPRHDILTLISQRLGVFDRLPDSVAALIQNKAEGNPFFSEELAFALRDAGWIEVVGGQCRVAPGVDINALVLPDNVQGVITSRIDRLTAPQQLALKVASAIGREFAFRTLRDIHPVETDKPRLNHYLEVLAQLELTLKGVAPELLYLFKHTITQDVAYNLMLFAQRRELHQTIGEWYEHEFEGRLVQAYPVLAHHWGRAAEGVHQHIQPEDARHVIHKAVDYLTKAGDQALQISAFREAVSAYETALALTPPGASIARNGKERGGIRATLLVKLGNTFEAMSDFRQATERLRAGLELARAADDIRLSAEALSGLCWVSARQGAHAEARALAEEAIELARAADDKATLALALRRLGVLSKGDRAAAIRHYEDSLRLYHEINDQKGIAACLNNLGNMAAGAGDYPGAKLYYGDGLYIAREAGDRLVVATFLGNLGEIARRQNDFEAATRYLQEALATYKEIGAREGVATNMLNLGWVAAARKDSPAALEYYREALAESTAIGALPRALGAISGIAGLCARFGDYQRAAELVGLALSHPASNAEVKEEAEPVLNAVRAALPLEAMALAQARGAARTLEEVVGEILAVATA